MTPRLRVVVADDHYLVREGVRRALGSDADLDVIAVVGDATELEHAVDRELPDAIVTDIRMPPTHATEGIDAAHRIRARHPRIGIVVLSQYSEAAYAMDLLRDGTAGMAYLLKERIGEPRMLVTAVRVVVAGGSQIDPDVVGALVNARRTAPPLAALTDREHEVLALMAEGRTNAGIADELHLSESSIEKYVSSVFTKLGLTDEPRVHRRVAAVLAHLHDRSSARPLDPGAG